jgi:hypothetical protein
LTIVKVLQLARHPPRRCGAGLPEKSHANGFARTIEPWNFYFLFLTPTSGSPFAMLTALEIVLGIDNIIFISILVGRLADQN